MQEGEGIDIAQKYNVQIYPTYLFINHDGSLYCRMDGGGVSKPKIISCKKSKRNRTDRIKQGVRRGKPRAGISKKIYNYFAKTG